MKLSSSSKPISSPGRTEKFPPPLMRFLRSNVGSKSRGRSRKSPLFIRKLKSITSSAHQGSTSIETQEPTSPKVTCIGQVRVRRSKNNTKNSKTTKNPTKCISKSSFCSCLPKPSSCKCKLTRPKWPKWVLWFGCHSARVRTESLKHSGSARFEEASVEHEHRYRYGQEQDSEDDEEYKRGRRSSVSLAGTTMETATTTPPRNALMLTRCRSAPYRSSSLACRFWGENEGEENKELATADLTLLNSRDSTSESREDHEDSTSSCGNNNTSTERSKCMQICDEQAVVGEEDSSTFPAVKNEGKTDDVDVDVDGGGKKGEEVNEEGNNGKKLRLMRSKSEPARKGLEKYDPQSSEFWQLRRLCTTVNCTPHVDV